MDEPPALRANVLLVDDDPRNLEGLISVLRSADYDLVTARGGPEALALLLQQPFAVLILDVMMPEMSGFELAKLIRARHKTAETPIIFLTAYGTEEEDIIQGYELGAVDYLVKPAPPPILRAKVAAFVKMYLHNESEKRFLKNLAMLGQNIGHADNAHDPAWDRQYLELLERHIKSRHYYLGEIRGDMRRLASDFIALRLPATQVINLHARMSREFRDSLTARERIAFERDAQLFLLEFLTFMVEIAMDYERTLPVTVTSG